MDEGPVRWGPPVVLRDLVIEHLRTVGSDSISGISRALASEQARPVHRLTMAGYLSALVDEGVLRERDAPPSKKYDLAGRETQMSVYQMVGRAASEAVSHADRTVAVTATLERLFRRPVFAEELRLAGCAGQTFRLEKVDVSEEQRRLLRGMFRRRSVPRVTLPRADPLFRAPADGLSEAVLFDLLRRVTLEVTQTAHLASPGTSVPPRQGLLHE